MSHPFEMAGLRVFERGWLSSNNILFAGRNGSESVLVDSGYVTHSAQTLALVNGTLNGDALSRVVNTHLHSDHCGGNAALQQAFGCQIDVPTGEADKVDRWDERALTYRDTGQQCPRFTRTGALRDGDDIQLGPYRWKVIAAPGHDPESVVLHQPELKLLISADALWQNGFGVVFPEIEGEAAFDEVRQTLDRLSRLRVDWVIPGHGAPFEDFTQSLARAHQRLEAFIADPVKHARHAAKVLIKFHLLEIQQEERIKLEQWLRRTRYMRLTHENHFVGQEFDAWAASLLSELAAVGAVRLANGIVHNA